MSYVGYIPLVKQFIDQFPAEYPFSLLEVGVDRGTTLIPLVAHLARKRENFSVVGVDILLQESTKLMLANLDLTSTQQVYCVQGNSLEVLPGIVKQSFKFDVVLLDGDHNYHTVINELSMLEDITHPHSLVICDDYNGRWSEKDLWYAERDGYQDVKEATQRIDTDKHGVKPAIDEWLEAHPDWLKLQPIPGEPIVLMRKRE